MRDEPPLRHADWAHRTSKQQALWWTQNMLSGGPCKGSADPSLLASSWTVDHIRWAASCTPIPSPRPGRPSQRSRIPRRGSAAPRVDLDQVLTHARHRSPGSSTRLIERQPDRRTRSSQPQLERDKPTTPNILDRTYLDSFGPNFAAQRNQGRSSPAAL